MLKRIKIIENRKEYKIAREFLELEGHAKVSSKKVRDRLHRDGNIVNLTAINGGYDVYTHAGYAAYINKKGRQ